MSEPKNHYNSEKDSWMFLTEYAQKLVITYTNGKSYHIPDAKDVRIFGNESKGFNIKYFIEEGMTCNDRVETIKTTVETNKYEVARIEYQIPSRHRIKHRQVYELMKIRKPIIKLSGVI